MGERAFPLQALKVVGRVLWTLTGSQEGKCSIGLEAACGILEATTRSLGHVELRCSDQGEASYPSLDSPGQDSEHEKNSHSSDRLVPGPGKGGGERREVTGISCGTHLYPASCPGSPGSLRGRLRECSSS